MGLLELQAGENSLDASIDPQLRIIAVRLKCRAATLAQALFDEVPPIGISGLVENQPRSVSRDKSGDQGGYHVEVTLEGVVDPGSADGESYELDAATAEVPIDQSPRVLILREAFGYDASASRKALRTIFPELLQDGAGGTVKNPMWGRDTFLEPGLIWTRNWVSQSLPGSVVASLGYIDNPPGNPPEISGNRNWLKIRARAQWRGNAWQITESWQLSGEGGFIREMYARGVT